MDNKQKLSYGGWLPKIDPSKPIIFGIDYTSKYQKNFIVTQVLIGSPPRVVKEFVIEDPVDTYIAPIEPTSCHSCPSCINDDFEYLDINDLDRIDCENME